MEVDEKLKAETSRLLDLIRKKRPDIVVIDSSKNDMIKNIDAYISDSEYFLINNDLVRAFEAVVWAWSWIEILEQIGVLKAQD